MADVKVRVMPDYECAPIWDDEDVGPIDPNELPISRELAERLWRGLVSTTRP